MSRADGSHATVALSIVNNNRKTMDRSRRSFPTPAGCFFASSAHPRVGFISPKCACAAALILRGIAARHECRCFHSRSALRCVSKHEDACNDSSSSFEMRACRFQVAARVDLRAPQDEDEYRVTTAHDVKQPFPFPRPHCCVRALPLCFTHPLEGWAERRETCGCCASAPVGRARNAARQAPSEAPCVP
jgi:hypothetical protein